MEIQLHAGNGSSRKNGHGKGSVRWREGRADCRLIVGAARTEDVQAADVQDGGVSRGAAHPARRPSPPGLFAPPPAAPPSQEDRLLAAASYVGYLAGFWLFVPISVYVLRRGRSRFIAFHALQAIIVHTLLIPIIIAGAVFGLVATMASRA